MQRLARVSRESAEGFSRCIQRSSPRAAARISGARVTSQDQLVSQAGELARRKADHRLTSAQEALRYCPALRASKFAAALYEPDCKDIDTNALRVRLR